MIPPVDYILAVDSIKLASYFLRNGFSDPYMNPFGLRKGVIATTIELIYRRTTGTSSVWTKGHRLSRSKRTRIGKGREAAPLRETSLGAEARPTLQAVHTKRPIVGQREQNGATLETSILRLPSPILMPVDMDLSTGSSGPVVVGVGDVLTEEPIVELVHENESTMPTDACLGDQTRVDPAIEPVVEHIGDNEPIKLMGEAVGDGHDAVVEEEEEINEVEEEGEVLYDPRPELDRLGALLCFVRVQGGRASLFYVDKGDPEMPPAGPRAVYPFRNNRRAYIPSPLKNEVMFSDERKSKFSSQWGELMAASFGDGEDE